MRAQPCGRNVVSCFETEWTIGKKLAGNCYHSVYGLRQPREPALRENVMTTTSDHSNAGFRIVPSDIPNGGIPVCRSSEVRSVRSRRQLSDRMR